MKKFTKIMIALALLTVTGNIANAQKVMVTWAGTGTSGYSGDGSSGKYANISNPYDVCMDAAHNLYFVDNANQRIRKVSAANGTITTIAGGGTLTTDGIPATSASIFPMYMCIDAAGNLYFSSSNEIKKINAVTGIITTVAGIPMPGYTGDGGLATSATLGNPQGICIDAAGNLYIVDQANDVIRKVTASTGIITTIAGTSAVGYTGDGGPAVAATLSDPIAICVNAAGDVFFSDQWGEYIREISAATGIISTIAGNIGAAMTDGVPATSTNIGNVYGMCIDGAGNIYIDDISCSCRKINMITGIINVMAGSLYSDGYNGDGLNAIYNYLSEPYGLCVDAAGSIYIADNYNNRIRKAIQLTHTPSFAYGKGQFINPCPASSFSINNQLAITDIDSAQTETWTVINAPRNGTLSGFPYATASVGTNGLVMPSGLAYRPVTGFSGNDSFRVMVSDGLLSDTVTIYINVPTTTPDAGTILGTPSVCVGTISSFTETVPGGAWSINPNSPFDSTTNATTDAIGDVSGNIPGLDTLVYTIDAGCIISATMIITVNAAPDPGYISGVSNILPGNYTTLSSTVTGGAWSSEDITVATVSSAGLVYGVANGYTDIIYTVSDGTCTGTAYFYLTVGPDSSTAVHNIAPIGIDNISVMPNPAMEHFTINVSSQNDEQVIITVTNMLGDKIKEITGTTNKPINATLDVPGIYLLNAATSHGNKSSKIVIE